MNWFRKQMSSDFDWQEISNDLMLQKFLEKFGREPDYSDPKDLEYLSYEEPEYEEIKDELLNRMMDDSYKKKQEHY